MLTEKLALVPAFSYNKPARIYDLTLIVKELVVYIFKTIALIIASALFVIEKLFKKEFEKSKVFKVILFLIVVIALGVNFIISSKENNNSIKQQKQNDSLMTLITGLKASAIHQDTISEESLKYKIKADKPVIVLDKLTITDECSSDSIYKPNITFYVSNIGKRVAEKLSYRTWIVSNDFTSSMLDTSETLEPLQPKPAPSHGYDFNPVLVKKQLPIYLCIEIKCTDGQTKRPITVLYFREYRESRWYFCENTIRNKMVAIINKHALPRIKP